MDSTYVVGALMWASCQVGFLGGQVADYRCAMPNPTPLDHQQRDAAWRRIAEEDLKLRGEGDVLGVRQSGLPGYRIARSEVHGQLITQARDEALRIMKDNPKLKGERGEALRCLLYLYERDEAVPLIGAG